MRGREWEKRKLSSYFSHWRALTRKRYDVAMEEMIRKMEDKTFELRRKKDLEQRKREEEDGAFKRYSEVHLRSLFILEMAGNT